MFNQPAHAHDWKHTNHGSLGASLWVCACGSTYDGASISAAKQAVRFDFNMRADAWAFMRACDAAGLLAGFPNYESASYSVKVSTTADNQTVRDLAVKFNGV